MLRMLDLEGSSFEVNAYLSNEVYSIDDPSDHLSDPSDQTSWAGYKYPCSVLCFILDAHRQKIELRAFCPKHTHT
ncbi:hypothetical protein HanXRQr2_Chr01g0012511 [Helianthus annuus]|uniref:Uncharacterized protein n=1 Tax=Helianthus annuus TaxID=4232 RepID=A0A9K3P269_HELAN|nr:hypothetical protein HanXRQr2_Chr01g0012511 [Helianthus annuus]